MNIPNTLTLLRILLVPALGYLLLDGAFGGAIWLFLLAGATDALDGFIAKHFNQCTLLGSLLDPLADKLLVVSSVVILAWLGYLPRWLAITIVIRDVVIVSGAVAFYARAGRMEAAPSVTSKLNTFVQLTLIFMVLGQAAGLLQAARWFPLLFGTAFFTTVVSGGQYVVVWGRKAGTLPVHKEKVLC